MIKPFADEYKRWLKEYLYVGGMPEVVADYIEYHDFTSVRDIQNRILSMYEQDFGKHASAKELAKLRMVWTSIAIQLGNKELAKLRMVWTSIAIQLGKDNKKFVFADVSEGGRAAVYENAVQWLCDNGLVYKLHNVSAPRMPLKAYEVYNNFKLYLLKLSNVI